MVKSLPAMQETWIGSLGWEYPLEKEMTTYSSILAWKIPRTEELGRFKSTGSRRVRHDRATNTFTFDLSGGSVAKTRCFHCRDTSSSPIPHTAQCGQKLRERETANKDKWLIVLLPLLSLYQIAALVRPFLSPPSCPTTFSMPLACLVPFLALLANLKERTLTVRYCGYCLSSHQGGILSVCSLLGNPGA